MVRTNGKNSVIQCHGELFMVMMFAINTAMTGQSLALNFDVSMLVHTIIMCTY